MVSEGFDFACGHAADLSGALILRVANFAWRRLQLIVGNRLGEEIRNIPRRRGSQAHMKPLGPDRRHTVKIARWYFVKNHLC
jgi:hypothetical protein